MYDIDNSRTAVALRDSTFLQWGLTTRTKKTKVLAVGRRAEVQVSNAVITIWEATLEAVSGTKSLSSIYIASGGTLDAEVANRVASASGAFARLRQAKVWSSKALSLSNQEAVFPVSCHVSLAL